MKNSPKKAETEKTSKKNRYSINAFILYFLLTSTTIFALGCEKNWRTKRPALAAPETAVIKANQLKPEALKIIRVSLADHNPLVRANAIEVIATTNQLRLMPKVQRLLQDEFVPVRFAAALAVGDSQYALAEKSIRQSLQDKDENVRIAAAYAMGKIRSPKYFQVLLNAIGRNDMTVRANTAMLLGKSGDKNALKYLYWAMQQKDSDDKVRFNVVQAIATLGDERIFPKLWAMRISGYADDRILAVQALGALGNVKAKNILITMLDDDILEVRLAAAEQLGALGDKIGETEVINVFEKNLVAGLDQQDLTRINMRIALAIGQIGTQPLKKFLPHLLRDPSKPVRIAAAKAVLQCINAK